ncbi:MAG: TonB-dependent receptor [Ignavibacteriaceae bacterium]|nr:TonB-dependent receptor [Ignavibacteriaceae bacterium]
MINRIFALALVIIIPFICFAQEEKKPEQNVELPEFVITGTEAVSVEKAKKIEPDFGSTISEEFLKPALSPEQLELRTFINPIKENINLSDSVHYMNGRFNAGIGSVSIPKADILVTSPFNDGIFEWFANAENRAPYVNNSDRTDLGGGINLSLFTKNDNSFLPGTDIKLHGNYNLSSYKFYGSTDSIIQRRTLNGGNVSVDVSNYLNNYFVYAASMDNEFNSLKNESFSENFLRLKGYGKLTLSAFNLSFDLMFKKQFLTNNSINTAHTGFGSIAPKIGLNISEVFKVEFGLTYSQIVGSIYFTPFASAAFKLDNNISFYGEYDPHADLLSASSFLYQNPYLNSLTLNGAYVQYNNSLKLAVKYEYEKYYQVNAGVKVLSSNEMPYYKSSVISGKFDVAFDDARILSAFVDMLFHMGPFGYYYGDVEVRSSKDAAGYNLPYVPAASASLIYGYDFSSIKLNPEIKLNYFSGSYTGIPNQTKLGNNVDLELKFTYQYKPMFLFTLEFSNLLLHDNYTWTAYKEMPFNVTAGISFIW